MVFGQVMKNPRRDACLRGRFGIVIFVIPVNGEELGAGPWHTDEIRSAIHLHLEIGVGQPAGERTGLNLTALPLRNQGNDFINADSQIFLAYHLSQSPREH